jgi:hypothetical protein
MLDEVFFSFFLGLRNQQEDNEKRLLTAVMDFPALDYSFFGISSPHT